MYYLVLFGIVFLVFEACRGGAIGWIVFFVVVCLIITELIDTE